jgi:hypothetical protein
VLELSHDFGQPGFQDGLLVGRNLFEGEAHPNVRMAVDYLGRGLENSLIPQNP